MTRRMVLERLADETWQRLCDARILEIRFGEETITDLLLLELKRLKPSGISIIQTPKAAEPSQGTDWEWWVARRNMGWIRMAVQAKRIGWTNNRYDALGHKVKGQLQIDVLERFAARNRALAVYCLFNHVNRAIEADEWQCGLPLDEAQLGCTLTPSSIVRTALNTFGARTFEALHRDPLTRPWRCWIACPGGPTARQKPGHDQPFEVERRCGEWPPLFGDDFIHQELPPEVVRGRQTGRMEYFSEKQYCTEGEERIGLPKWVVVFDSD